MNISSTVGSIATGVWAAQPLSYAVSKTALNMVVRPFLPLRTLTCGR